MTLNLTVLSREGIHQSSDYILWDPAAGVPTSMSSTKTVRVAMLGSMASVSYAGVGSFGGFDTAEWVTRWLTKTQVGTFDDLVELLRVEGSAWLERIRRRTGRPWHHTFIATAYVEDVATAAYISNFEQPGHPRTAEPWEELKVSTVSASGRPVVIVTGCLSPAISRQQRRALQRLVENHGSDTGRVRQAMQDLNRSASVAEEGTCPVSPECFVVSFDKHGGGATTKSAIGAEPRLVLHGMDVSSMLGEFAREQFPDGYRVVGSTFATSQSGQAPTKPCVPVLSKLAASSGFEMVELPTGEGLRAVASAVSSSGIVIGASAAEHGGPDLACAWTVEGEMTFLEGLGGITGFAYDVNSTGRAVGSVEDHRRRSVAMSWTISGSSERLTASDVSHSGALAVTDSDTVVGWVSIHETGGEQTYHRPSVWRPGHECDVLREIPDGCEWGTAVDADPTGRVLVNAWRDGGFVPVLWEFETARVLVDKGSGVASVGFLDSGEIVGWVRDKSGQPLAVTWSPRAEKWSLLGTPSGWLVTAVSGSGHIGGAVEIDGWLRPWVMAPRQDPVLLEHFAYHHHKVRGISRDGWVAGEAQTDHGFHGIVWKARGPDEVG